MDLQSHFKAATFTIVIQQASCRRRQTPKVLFRVDFYDWGGTKKRQISKPPTPYPPVSISANNHNRQSQRLGG